MAASAAGCLSAQAKGGTGAFKSLARGRLNGAVQGFGRGSMAWYVSAGRRSGGGLVSPGATEERVA